MLQGSKACCCLYTLSATGYIQASLRERLGRATPTAAEEKSEGGLFLKGLLKVHQYNQHKGSKFGLIK